MPVRLVLTEGTVADCTQANLLTADLEAQYLVADRGYDTNAVVAGAMAQGMEPVIPPRRHRKPESTEGIPRRRSDEGCGVRAWVGEDRMPVKWTMGSVAATPGDVCGPW